MEDWLRRIVKYETEERRHREQLAALRGEPAPKSGAFKYGCVSVLVILVFGYIVLRSLGGPPTETQINSDEIVEGALPYEEENSITTEFENVGASTGNESGNESSIERNPDETGAPTAMVTPQKPIDLFLGSIGDEAVSKELDGVLFQASEIVNLGEQKCRQVSDGSRNGEQSTWCTASDGQGWVKR